MSYEKYTWQTGEVITAAKLNNMEDGIDDKLIVTMLDSASGELDASYADLLAAWTAKKQVLLFCQKTSLGGVTESRIEQLASLLIDNGVYIACFAMINGDQAQITTDDYAADTDSEHMKYPSD